MSYTIYYDKAFIRIGDKFVPFVCHGDSEDVEDLGNRIARVKMWGVLNGKHRDQLLFTVKEISELARDCDLYSQEHGRIYKSLHQSFGPGEFGCWIKNGIGGAYTVEEYHSFGNRFYVFDFADEWRQHPFSTTDELLKILRRLGPIRELNIQVYDGRKVRRPFRR